MLNHTDNIIMLDSSLLHPYFHTFSHTSVHTQALINDNEAASTSIRRMEEAVQQLVELWRGNLRDVEARLLPRLLGDATLAAAYVTYGGPLLPSQVREGQSVALNHECT